MSLRLWLGIALRGDEGWTRMIVRQAEWSGLRRKAWRDSNATFCDLLLRCGTMMAGDGGIALRVPGLRCGVAASALPLLCPMQGLSYAAWAGWG